MSTTPNLGLPVYGLSDTPDWMDTNNGFEKLDNIVGGAANVHLDFANPLYTFDATHLEYTAVKDCYLYGTIIGKENAQFNIRINGTKVAGGFVSTNSSYPTISFSPLLLREGDVVTVSALDPTYPYRDCLGVYEGEIVSDTFVWNEAIVELDYGNPLHSFTTSALTFTATKRCWLVGALSNGRTVTINGTKISEGMNSATTELNIPLSEGDVVVSNQENQYLHVFDGTIKGSAPGNSSGGDVLELLDIDNAVVLTTSSYTAPKNGAIIGSNLLSGSGNNVTLTADGIPIMMAPANTSPQRDNAAVYGIQKGTVLQLSGAVEPLQCSIRFIPYKYESIAPEITVYNEAEVELDYANPLYVFGENNRSYTAIKDCWLVGCIGGGTLPELKINNTTIMKAYYSASTYLTQIPVYYKLTAGDVVTLTGYSANVTYLSVFEGIVSGSVGNLTGAWIPNYSDHIASLTYNGGTYTATEDCIVEIGASPNTNTAAKLYVNGYVIATSYASTSFYGFNRTVMLHKNDVLTWENCSNGTFYGEVFGLV